MTFTKLIRTFLQKFPPPARKGIYKAISKLPFGSTALSRYHSSSLDAQILSFPKCGRTWLRMMLAKAIQLHSGHTNTDFLRSNYLLCPAPGIPLVKVSHDNKAYNRTPGNLITDKTMYTDMKVILLIRDLRDVIVSQYFQEVKRRKRYNGSLSAFLSDERGSTDTFIRFYNIWAENRHIPADFLLVRYEDIHSDPEKQLKRLCTFLGLDKISDQVIREAVEFASFDNMRQMELNAAAGEKGKLKARDKKDTETFKSRRGKVGGFVDYLTQPEIEYLNRKLALLSSFYGYEPSQQEATTKKNNHSQICRPFQSAS